MLSAASRRNSFISTFDESSNFFPSTTMSVDANDGIYDRQVGSQTLLPTSSSSLCDCIIASEDDDEESYSILREGAQMHHRLLLHSGTASRDDTTTSTSCSEGTSSTVTDVQSDGKFHKTNLDFDSIQALVHANLNRNLTSTKPRSVIRVRKSSIGLNLDEIHNITAHNDTHHSSNLTDNFTGNMASYQYTPRKSSLSYGVEFPQQRDQRKSSIGLSPDDLLDLLNSSHKPMFVSSSYDSSATRDLKQVSHGRRSSITWNLPKEESRDRSQIEKVNNHVESSSPTKDINPLDSKSPFYSHTFAQQYERYLKSLLGHMEQSSQSRHGYQDAKKHISKVRDELSQIAHFDSVGPKIQKQGSSKSIPTKSRNSFMKKNSYRNNDVNSNYDRQRRSLSLTFVTPEMIFGSS